MSAEVSAANSGEVSASPRQQVTRSSLRSIQTSSPMRPSSSAAAAADETGHNATATTAAAAAAAAAAAEAVTPFPSMGGGLEAFHLRQDPDAQATVTDFLDFTEYLPSDIMRSLTLIGQLDQTYIDASNKVHELTARWGRGPSTGTDAADMELEQVKLRADISARLNHGISSRIYAYDEAERMAKNVNRHYHRAKTILDKLQTMMDNYAEAEQEQQEQQEKQQKQREQEQKKQEQQQQEQQQNQNQSQQKKTGAARVHRQRVPRITVPGEVLAPYELDYDLYSDESDVSSPTSSDESPPPMAAPLRYGSTTLASHPRIKVHKAGLAGGAAGLSTLASSAPKPPKVRMPRAPRAPGQPYLSTSSVLAQLKPPPENAVIGSADAPWLQLTPYELAKLRKRMKKNAQWTPSETMIARELKSLGRNLEAYKEAKRKAEEDGQPFDGALPEAVVEADGVARAPPGALSMDAAVAAEHKQLTNRGMKLNEAKKLKNNLAQLAAQEAEESTRKMLEQARALLLPYGQPTGEQPGPSRRGSIATATRATTPMPRKRKRDTAPPEAAEGADTTTAAEGSVEATATTASPNMATAAVMAGTASSGSGSSAASSQRQVSKRLKTETPVPIPQHAASVSTSGSAPSVETPVHPPMMRHSTTPVPVPIPMTVSTAMSTPTSVPMAGLSISVEPTGGSAMAQLKQSTSPLSIGSGLSVTTTTMVPLKPAAETPVPVPIHSPKKSTTPIHPPVRELRTREAARKETKEEESSGGRATSKTPSRATTPAAAGVTGAAGAAGATWNTTETTRRPQSRGASVGGSQELESTLASERTRRVSTARTTPAPGGPPGLPGAEAVRVPHKRVKRPAPGVVSRMSSGGNAAVGRRKAAPRKKRGSQTATQQQTKRQGSSGVGGEVDGEGEVEVDDEGNVIDADEPRYCVCNRVSFGTMIQCDNVENCRQEWFHLECVGLAAGPARTTKWYCPDCRVLLKIGEKGEVSARGVKM